MFQGRYGNDQFNQALSILGLIALALGMVLGWLFPGNFFSALLLPITWLCCIVLMLFRMFSRNFEARRRENQKFLHFIYTMRNGAGTWQQNTTRARQAKHNPTFGERRKYKYFLCTQCAQRLRVPRGKGKLRVTCTRCGNKFEIKS